MAIGCVSRCWMPTAGRSSVPSINAWCPRARGEVNPMKLHYRLLNVFTRDGRALSGNPLCVFEDGTALDTQGMQALARQFNLSETTFLLPSRKANARVRIF